MIPRLHRYESQFTGNTLVENLITNISSTIKHIASIAYFQNQQHRQVFKVMIIAHQS